jgi:hypothetical protein
MRDSSSKITTFIGQVAVLTAVAVRRGNPHAHVDVPPLRSIEAIEICVLIVNSEVLLAAVYKFQSNHGVMKISLI